MMVRINLESDEDRDINAKNIIACIDEEEQFQTILQGNMSVEDILCMCACLTEELVSSVVINVIEQEGIDHDILPAAGAITHRIMEEFDSIEETILKNVVKHFADKFVESNDDLQTIMKNLGKISKNAQIVAIDMKEFMRQNELRKNKEESENGERKDSTSSPSV